MTSNQQNSPNSWIEQGGSFVAFFAIFALLAWQVTAPLMIGLLWAALLAFTVKPVYDYFNRRIRFRKQPAPSLAAGITLVIVGFVIIIPLVLIFFSLGNEVTKLVASAGNFFSGLEPDQARDPYAYVPSWMPDWITSQVVSFLTDTEAVTASLQKLAAWTGTFLTGFSRRIIQGASSLALDLAIILMTSFFFIRDGGAILAYIKSITPLCADEKELFFSRAKHMVNSVVYGIVLTVAIQALLGAIGWWIAGLNSPAFFGMLMFFFGMFPAGTSVVWLPGAIYLAATGHVKSAVFLLLWGGALVSMIDNLMRPFLIKATGNGEEISTLLIIIGLFGGVIAWGFIGVFLGPLVMVLFTIVLDIYRARRLKRQEDFS